MGSKLVFIIHRATLVTMGLLVVLVLLDSR